MRKISLFCFIILFLFLGCKKVQESSIPPKRLISPVGFIPQVQENKPANLSDLIKQELEKDPASTQRFLQETVDLAVAKHPGMAIQIEKYASEELKKEVERWKNNANVSNLLRLEEENKKLKNSLFTTESGAKDYKYKAEKLKVELDKAILEIQNLLVFRERFTDIRDKYNAIVSRINKQHTKGVPVIIVNTWNSTAYVRIFNGAEKNEEWTFTVQGKQQVEIQIPPGSYDVGYYWPTANELYARRSLVVTKSVSVDNKYHGILMTH